MVQGRRILILSILGVALFAATPAPSSDGGRTEQRMRLVSLQTLETSRKAMIKGKWKDLARVDGLLKDLQEAEEEASSATLARDRSYAQALLEGAKRRAELAEQRRKMIEDLLALYNEVDSIRQSLKEVKAQLEENKQVLDGYWHLTMMPAGTKGDVHLNQDGTLVTGDYSLENGQTGSLQGTFVNKILVIERIDQRYGKMGRFEGKLLRGDRAIRGSWYSYDFTSGRPITGPFALDRVRGGEVGP